MIGWAILAIYAVGWVIAARKFAAAMIDDAAGILDDPLDNMMARVVGGLVGIVWPIGLIFILVTGRLPKGTKQMEIEHDKLQARIRELEGELGMRERL